MERKGICKNVGVCSKANKVQIITDDDAEFVCPECGEELQPYVEERKEPKKKNNKPIVLGAAAVAVIAAVAGGIAAFSGGSEEPVEETPVDTPEIVAVDPDTVVEVKTDTVVKVDTVVVEKEVEKVKVVEKPAPKTPAASSGTLRLSYGTYTGAMKGGYPHGQGKLTYSASRQINRNDAKARTAEPGDYVIGEFFNGFVVYGKHYDSAGNLKGSLNFGVGSESSYESK